MFCSTIIPTVGRPTLRRAVESVLSQPCCGDRVEVIVVNDSGRPLRTEPWQQSSDRVRIIDTNRKERSVARNTGAAVSSGKYLHFLDDDDVLLPGSLEAFWEAAQDSDACWLHGGWQTVDNEGTVLAEYRPPLDGNIAALLVAGEGLPLQASLMRANAFFQIGGFDAAPSSTGVEDRDLGRRLALFGSVAHVPALVAQVRIGEQGSTTEWPMLAERDRWGRERALGIAGSFARLRASARSPYWKGRLCRAYISSSLWNLRRRNLAIALSRGFEALQLNGADSLSSRFWLGLRTRVK